MNHKTKAKLIVFFVQKSGPLEIIKMPLHRW